MLTRLRSRVLLTRRHSLLRFFSSAETKPPPPPPQPPAPDSTVRMFQNLVMDVERETRRKNGLDASQVKQREEKEFEIMPVKALLKMVRKKSRIYQPKPNEESDHDSDEEDFDEKAAKEREFDAFDRKLGYHRDLLRNFTKSDTVDEAHNWMRRVDKFENMHFQLRPEYRVIGELVNRLKVAEGKEKFLFQMKLNRALKLVQWKEAFDPNNPANYAILKKDQGGPSNEVEENMVHEDEKPKLDEEDDMMEFNDMKEKDNILLEKLTAIDRQLDEKLAALDHTFGRKGKLLEEEIRNLAEERNILTEQKRQPLARKGFEVKLIDVNRTVKVTKGGQVVKYTALVVCGNYEGVIGYAKAKAPAVPVAVQKAIEKSYQNLHYVERHEQHTIAHAVQTSIKKTKLYLWPASTRSGVKAGRTVKAILNLAGFKDVKSKVIGSHNPLNTVKVVFKALNAIETGKDVQQKFGRTVVESYLL